MNHHGLEDRPADAVAGAVEPIGDGFRRLERHDVTLNTQAHGVQHFQRDVLRSGPVVGVLAVDPARAALVVIRQFRVAAALAIGLGDMVEIVAGRQDVGETAAQAAMRECIEEIGVKPARLVQIMRLMPAPALTDEIMTLFLAEVDSTGLPDQAGLEDEHEFIQPFAVPLEAAWSALETGRILNAPLLISLHWLRANLNLLSRPLSSAC